MNRKRTARGFVFASVLLVLLAVPVDGLTGIGLSAAGALCAAVALRLLTVGGAR